MYLLNNYGFEETPNPIEFVNNAGSTIPPFGILRVTGTTILSNREILTVDQPNTFGSQYFHFVNSGQSVAAGKYGTCFNGFPVSAAFTTGDGTPAFGQIWGPQSGTWLLKINTFGFRVVGTPDNTNGVVSVIRDPFLKFRGIANADIASGAVGTVSIYYRSDATTMTDTTVDTPTSVVLNLTDTTAASGKKCWCEWMPYFASGVWTEGWVITGHDC